MQGVFEMITQLIEKAELKAGNQQALAKRFNIRYNRFGDYKAGRRIPDDALIGELAEYVGLNPIETILQCKLETDKEKATLWQAWLSKIVVRSAGLEPTPQASEAYRLMTQVILIIQLLLKPRILSHSLNARNALY